MGKLDTSKAGQLRVLAERLRRDSRNTMMTNYIEMMERSAAALDAEALLLENARRCRPGVALDIVI